MRPEVNSVTVLVPLDDVIKEAKLVADQQFRTMAADEPMEIVICHEFQIGSPAPVLRVTFGLAGTLS